MHVTGIRTRGKTEDNDVAKPITLMDQSPTRGFKETIIGGDKMAETQFWEVCLSHDFIYD